MQVHHSLQSIAFSDAWLTVGIFDGVHLGHQTIIRQLVDGAHQNGLPAVVLTFDPHPVSILKPDHPLELLSDMDERAEIFESLGVDALVAHPFNEQVAALSAETFVSRLKQAIQFTQFWVGHDFAMGHNREGNIPRLEALGKTYEYQLNVVPPLVAVDTPVSSSRIRRTLRAGQVAAAAEMLGRPYTLRGVVAMGAQRGRTIGVPTANVAVPASRLVPAAGVYACRVRHAGKSYPAATNIGVRPTFEDPSAPITIEAHLLEYSGDLYGKELQVGFYRRLRGETKFDSIDGLVAQIQLDIHQTKEVFHETLS